MKKSAFSCQSVVLMVTPKPNQLAPAYRSYLIRCWSAPPQPLSRSPTQFRHEG